MQERELYNRIKRLAEFQPSTEVNDFMSCLTTYCCNNTHIMPSLSNMEIKFIRDRSNIAETNLEIHWANKLLEEGSKYPNIEDFVYHSNYRDLVNLEILNIKVYKKNIKKILFIGGGALPITAIILAQKYNYNVTILERDQESYDISTELISKLTLNNKINIVLCSALYYVDYDEYDLIYIAAMVGDNQKDKDAIINMISGSALPGTIILIRSAFAMKELLYYTYNFKGKANINLLIEVRPHNHIVNSFFVLQKT